jgi:purine-nucleoside phosphorylase
MAYSRQDYERAAEILKSKTAHQPTVGLVLGSGLGPLADTLEDRVIVHAEEIPGWPVSTAPGHSGKLVIGRLEGQVVVAQQGRAHFYEGYDLEQVTFPIRVMYHLGVQTLILTNAAGGVNPAYRVGDLMILNDHINFMGMAGFNALRGPNDDSLGERFVGLVRTYDPHLRELAVRVAEESSVPLHQGVYICLSGPTFETPAEVRMVRLIGGDAVGMSTVHEVIVARHMGMRVLACSGITNAAADSIDYEIETNHDEVLEAGKVLVPRLTAVLRGVLRNL